MNRLKIAFVTAFFIFPLFSGFNVKENKTDSFSLFPEITFSNACEFESAQKTDERVEVVEENEDVEIRFKFFDWLMSVF